MNNPQVASRFLDLRALAAVQHLRFSTRHRIEGSYSGRHVSRQRGGSGEFVDYRQYTQGDDLRHLDWRVMARTGRTYLKLYQDETNLVCTALIDASGSMTFGAGDRNEDMSKLEYAQFFVTALAHVITRGGDRIGVASVSDQLHDYVAPGSTPQHAQLIYQTVEQIQTRPTTNLAGSIERLFQQSAGRGVLMVFSDFLVDRMDEVFSALRVFRHRGWEIVIMHLLHPGEERLPTGTAFRFVGLEGEAGVTCSPTEIARRYQDNLQKHLTAVRTSALSARCDYHLVSTAIPYMHTLSKFLVERSS